MNTEHAQLKTLAAAAADITTRFARAKRHERAALIREARLAGLSIAVVDGKAVAR